VDGSSGIYILINIYFFWVQSYPHCLYILDLLQDENFRNQISQPGLSDYIYKQQYYQWKYYRNHRVQPNEAQAVGPMEVKSEALTK